MMKATRGMISLERAFTLIELLVVVAILGILAAFSVTNYAEYRRSVYDKIAQAELDNAILAITLYMNENPTGTFSVDCNNSTNQVCAPFDRYGFNRSDKVQIATVKWSSGAYYIAAYAYDSGMGCRYGSGTVYYMAYRCSTLAYGCSGILPEGKSFKKAVLGFAPPC